MKNLNLSRWALEHKSLVVYLMLVVALAGLHAISASSAARRTRPSPSRPWWSRRCGPAPRRCEIVQQVTDRIEKKLEELPNLDYLKSYSKPGESVVFVNLKDSVRASEVPDLWYQVRKKVGDIKQTLPQGVQGPFFNDEFGDTYSLIFALTADGFSHRELRDHAERLRAELLERARRRQDRPHRHAGREDLSRVLDPAARGHGPRHFAADSRRCRRRTPSSRAAPSTPEPRRSPSAFPASSPRKKASRPINFRANGRFFRLSDIAKVRRAYVDPQQPMFRFNGTPAIGLAISMAKNGDVLGVRRAHEGAARQADRRPARRHRGRIWSPTSRTSSRRPSASSSRR